MLNIVLSNSYLIFKVVHGFIIVGTFNYISCAFSSGFGWESSFHACMAGVTRACGGGFRLGVDG